MSQLKEKYSYDAVQPVQVMIQTHSQQDYKCVTLKFTLTMP